MVFILCYDLRLFKSLIYPKVIKEGTNWLQPEGSHGPIPRKTAWMTAPGWSCQQLGLPIHFIGLGETPDDIEPFDPGSFVDALFATE